MGMPLLERLNPDIDWGKKTFLPRRREHHAQTERAPPPSNVFHSIVPKVRQIYTSSSVDLELILNRIKELKLLIREGPSLRWLLSIPGYRTECFKQTLFNYDINEARRIAKDCSDLAPTEDAKDATFKASLTPIHAA
jgi:hypothetical protein